jgi:pyridoxine/pyridoxamine 5'-phosphate oxidase
MSSNVVQLKVWSTYKVSFNRSTSYVATVIASGEADAKSMVLRTLDDEDMELMTEILTSKGTTYTDITGVRSE